MNTNFLSDAPMASGTLGGFLLAWMGIEPGRLFETVFLAGIGAVVSFATSLALKWLLRYWRKK